jgi:hypothetical protein
MYLSVSENLLAHAATVRESALNYKGRQLPPKPTAFVNS